MKKMIKCSFFYLFLVATCMAIDKKGERKKLDEISCLILPIRLPDWPAQFEKYFLLSSSFNQSFAKKFLVKKVMTLKDRENQYFFIPIEDGYIAYCVYHFFEMKQKSINEANRGNIKKYNALMTKAIISCLEKHAPSLEKKNFSINFFDLDLLIKKKCH